MKLLLEKVGKKIKTRRLSLGLNIEQAQARGISYLGKKCISQATMYRIESGDIAKLASLEQYLFILDMDLKNLLEGTELGELLVLNKNERLNGYTYSAKAFSTIINNPNHSFLAQEVILQTDGKTDLDYAAGQENSTTAKFVYVVQGELTAIIDQQEYHLKNRATLSFNSCKPHQFINHGACDCIFVMVESPGRY